MNIHHEHLLSFVALVQTGSVSAAAKARYLTQPAISNQLKLLQDNIGMQLYRRQGRGVSLTGAGELFYTHALKVQQALQSLNDFTDELQGLQTGRIYLAASQTIAGSLLPAALVSFREQHPQIEVFVDSGNSQQVFDDMAQHDLGLVECPLPSPIPSCCRVQQLGFDHIVVVMPIKHPLAHCSSIGLEQLKAYPLIWREQGSGTREALEQAWLAEYETLPQVHLCLGGVAAILEAVRQGLGIAVASRFCLPSGENILTTRPLNPQLTRPMSLLLPAHASPLARKFATFLTAYMQKKLRNNSI